MPRRFNRITILSDLHLAPAPELGNFATKTGEKLVEWTRQLGETDAAHTALVLNGDIVDFLLVPQRSAVLDLRNTRQFVRQTLEQLSQGNSWVGDWRKAIVSFGSAGGRIVFLPGNHDPEWLIPAAREELARWLVNDAAIPTWMTVVTDSDDWEATVGPWTVQVLHGHQFDTQNAMDREKVFSALRSGNDSVALPPGSELVLGPLRHFKQAQDPATGQRRWMR
jgi:3',5'-cyclic AMP phosphodiesterase CpdA